MIKFCRSQLISSMALIGLLLFGLVPVTAGALTTLPAEVIDDFEDNDASDWIFFGGNNAGGGGGTAGDRPRQGSFYLSTGWGGEGSGSVFYGGFFKNFDEIAQLVPPADPWFNIWVLNQSDATVDQYNLEITLREDINGDGWVNGVEDSIQLVVPFSSNSFDDEWQLISVPLSSFTNAGTGGNGSFDGNLDEVVIVVAGVAGASGSTVEVDLDQLSFTSGGPVSSAITLFDGMEHGDPLNNGWFAFNGSVGGGGIAAENADLPPADGGAFALASGWGSGGTAGFYGGFGRTRLTDLGGTDHFNFWIDPDAGQDYRLEINLQEDDTSDDGADAALDDEFQFNCVISASGPCAVSGGGWQQVSIPLADFFDDNSFFTGGNGVLDAVAAANGGNGQLVNVVVAVIGSGTDVNFRTDYWAFSAGPLAETDDRAKIIDNFESGLPAGNDTDGVPLGFYTFSDGSPVAIATTTAVPAPVPDSTDPNNVLALAANVTAFAGFIHGFENAAVDTWTPQDWSSYEGFSLWLYGQNTGTTLFLDIVDNRNPGSGSDDGERFSVSFSDDFSGWQLLKFPFSDFVRKEIGNGAPNDGFGLTQVHGWALGTLKTPGQVTYYVDDASLYGTARLPELAVNFAAGGYNIEEGMTGDITVQLNRPMNSDDPAQVSVDYFSEPGAATPGRDYTPVSGTLTFVNGGPSELSFQLETFDNGKWEGNKPIPLKLASPVDVATGVAAQALAYIIDNDVYDPALLSDFEELPYLWQGDGNTRLSIEELADTDPMARPGQDGTEGILRVDSPVPVQLAAPENWCNAGSGVIPVSLLTTESFDALAVDHTSVRLGMASETHIDRSTGLAVRHASDVDQDGDLDLVLHFRLTETGLDCHTDSLSITGQTFTGQAIASDGAKTVFGRDFPIGQDWSGGKGLSFWYYGHNSGDAISVQLKDNRAPDTGPSGWGLVWSEEFNDPAGTLPNPDIWTYEIGDGSRSGIPGWGNDELQYYTDDPANAATDGQGNMVLTLRQADGSLSCYYGPCEYTSARLVSKRKAEFAYGRIESRILVPEGGGLWPAFWSLGTDIDRVGWPQTGEIDFMEFVGRLPNEIFGTIHGPGYAGGGSYGNAYDFGEPVYNNYHTFTVEWQPDLIKWYVDGFLYHSATPADVAPNEWVFNDPVFLLLNMAIGGNFGGAVDPDIRLPQSMAIDYIRVYQAADSAERFEVTFVDDFDGWQQVEIPFAEFSRSTEQPAGAPSDGLGLTEVWGYRFIAPIGNTLYLDQVRLASDPPATAITVSNFGDSGDGSLRRALAEIASGGTIVFDPVLAGGTIGLTSGQLVVDRNVTIDASAAPGIAVSGEYRSRVFSVAPDVVASMNDLEVFGGYGAPQGGGILNLGTLNLDRVVVRANTENSAGPANFAFGGGGIYNGDGATLNLTDCTVADNASLNQPGGGIYGSFGSTINITRSTISGNIAGDVAGGLRSLGNASVVNSTFSGNQSTAWHGGAIFHTDGQLTVASSTFTGNSAPAGTAAGIVVATFGGGTPGLTLTNSILAGQIDGVNCAIENQGGAGTITSAGGNIDDDGSCNLTAPGDQPNTDPLLGPLSANGGPTLTHALTAGSPAVDSAVNAVCPATDQRGVARPQGASCDVGAFELQ